MLCACRVSTYVVWPGLTLALGTMEGEREPKLGPSSGVEEQERFLVVPCVLGLRVRLTGKEMSGGGEPNPRRER